MKDKVLIPLKFNLVNVKFWGITYRSRNDPKDSCITQAYPSMGDILQKLKI